MELDKRITQRNDTGKPKGRNRRAHEGATRETPGIFIVLSGSATTDGASDFVMLVRGGAYGKRWQRCILFFLPSFLLISISLYPAICSWHACRSLTGRSAAHRVSEEASFHWDLCISHLRPTAAFLPAT